MGVALTPADEGVHTPGGEPTWNESRYLDFWDRAQGIGGWLRIGMRPNAGYAEATACVYLPDGRIAFSFERAAIDGNALQAGGQSWMIDAPYDTNRVTYQGETALLSNGWLLADPKQALRDSTRASCDMDLTAGTCGLGAVMGADQDHIEQILLPGQADAHYQHLAWTSGTVRVGPDTWAITGVGGKDHSWGPRNWLAKTHLRWFTATFEDGSGFMLMRAVGPTKQTRAGHLWDGQTFHLVDDFVMKNAYRPAPHFELRETTVSFAAAGRRWSAVARPDTWLPLRYRQSKADGTESVLRIVKSPLTWTASDGRVGGGGCEFHDVMDSGMPAGLDD